MSPEINIDYRKSQFSAPIAGRTKTFDLYARGEGPPVVIIQELPGIGPETLRLADRLVEAGLEVNLPHLFGPIGRVSYVGNFGRVLCMRREFALFARNRSSPIVDWLAALCRELKSRSGHPGVGVIGMCLTGNFAISLMADEAVLAGVASQPSMPSGAPSALHVRPEDVDDVRARLAKVGPMLCYRFEKDLLCRASKFEHLDKALNDDCERITLRTLPGNGHSVFTLDFVDAAGHPTREALDEVIAYFRKRLVPSAG